MVNHEPGSQPASASHDLPSIGPQEPSTKRPRTTLPHETGPILDAKANFAAHAKPRKAQDFGNLLIGSFASGKASAVKVP